MHGRTIRISFYSVSVVQTMIRSAASGGKLARDQSQLSPSCFVHSVYRRGLKQHSFLLCFLPGSGV